MPITAKRSRTEQFTAIDAAEPPAGKRSEEATATQQESSGCDQAAQESPAHHGHVAVLAAPESPGRVAAPASPESHGLIVPHASPAGNRARFLSGMQPTKVTCDLTTTPMAPGLRFSFEAIVIVVYPASTSSPSRRYIELMDPHGTTGITVWNQYVQALGPSAVGCLVKFTRLALTMHNGKKILTMAKDSTMHVETSTHDGMLMQWWRGLLTESHINCLQFHDIPSLSVVNISGILGFIQVEEKMVKGEPKQLLVLYLTDRFGKVEVRSWNHSDTEFKRFQEKPILLRRVRVCMYAGTRTGELLTGPNGTMITSEFDHDDLDKYWAE
jgi:hypothetical protein